MRTIVSLLLLLLMLALAAYDAVAQQLRDVARTVDSSVVVVKTVEKNLVGAEFIIGAPYGLGHSLSAGHISARRDR